MNAILTAATKAAFQATLNQPEGAQRYSQFPVHAQEFWSSLFAAARDPKKHSKSSMNSTPSKTSHASKMTACGAMSAPFAVPQK